MLTGFIWYDRGWYKIQVKGYPRVNYLWYSKREAIQKYRLDHGLRGKHIQFTYCG